MPTYYYPPVHETQTLARYDTSKRLSSVYGPKLDDVGVGGTDAWELLYPFPTNLTLLAYSVAAGFPTPPTNGQEWIELSRQPGLGGTSKFIPEIGSVGWILDPQGAFLDALSVRVSWFLARDRARHLVRECYGFYLPYDGDVTAEPYPLPQNAMAYGNRATKNPGAAQRINDLVRNNPDLKAKLNSDPTIVSKALDMFTILNNLSTALGFAPSASEFNPSTAAESFFPCPKNMWLGYLPVSSYDVDGNDQWRKLYAQKAGIIRRRATGVIKAYKLLADAYDLDVPANPGGPVGT